MERGPVRAHSGCGPPDPQYLDDRRPGRARAWPPRIAASEKEPATGVQQQQHLVVITRPHAYSRSSSSSSSVPLLRRFWSRFPAATPPAMASSDEKKAAGAWAAPGDTEQGIVHDLAAAVELHPTPTDDPLDPLNFSRARKWTCLAIVMWLYFLFTYITTTTVPSFAQLQAQYAISYAEVNWTVAIPALGLAVGPLIWSTLADTYGRRVVFLAGTVIALAATVGAAKAPTYGGYMAARFFQGFGVAPASTVGLAIINDLFFEHERGQKLGLWVLAIDMGLLVGPLVGGFMDLVDQFWVEWLTALLFAALLLAELFFLPETLYPRARMLARAPPAAAAAAVAEKGAAEPAAAELPRTLQLPFVNVRVVPGIAPPRLYEAFVYVGRLCTYPNVAAAIGVYCFAWYWWVLSVITMLPSAYAQYSPQIQGLLFLGLILGTLLSELCCSGTLSDALIVRLTRRRRTRRTPEMRLWLAYPAAVLSAAGLVLWGVAVDRGWHWIVGQVAFFLFAAGIQMGNTAYSTYIVDCYPRQAVSVVTFYAVLLNFAAFVDPFFIAPWQAAQGWTWCFAVQGLVVAAVMLPATAALQRWGARVREWRGEPPWLSAEYAAAAA